ncbi:MAG: hypothetical protein KKB03_03120 [Nanoarchaeota archaeon]|nr:hypothetical protein [Nanoarchaeota archaeon]MBU2520206.1 hypothetical protein [Nanoarchaeota archaeon]
MPDNKFNILITFGVEASKKRTIKDIMNHEAIKHLDLERDFDPIVNGSLVDLDTVPPDGSNLQFVIKESKGPKRFNP